MTQQNGKPIDELTVYDGETGATLFRDPAVKYVIPLYQRAYAWADAEIEQLIDDILEHTGERYYIGSLVVCKRDREFEVIDGQQRLTTLLLLMIELGLPVKNVLSFACRKRADDTLAKYIDGKEVLEDDLEQNLVRGRRIIAEKLAKLAADGVDQKAFLEKLAHLKLYRIQVPPHTDLNRYFEIMNTRGEQLEQHDILKAELMGAIQNDDARDLFAKAWEACSDMTGYVQMHLDTGTRALLFGSDWNNLDLQNLDYDGFAERDGEDESPELDEILAPGFQVRYDDGGTDRDERVRFESVIDFPYFLLHVLRVYVKVHRVSLPEGEELPQLLDDKKLIREFERVLRRGTRSTGRRGPGQPRRRRISREAFSLTFMECLLKCRFLFDKYIIKREYANESADGEWSLKQLEVSGRKSKKKAYFKKTEFKSDEEGNKDILMLQSALRVSYTSPKVMHWITELLIWAYPDSREMGQYREAVNAIAVRAVKADFLDAGDCHMGVSTPHIVFNYLDYLLWRENKQKYADFVFEFRNSVEHWYPQHPSEGTFDPWPQEELDDFGNLCMIQRSVNSKFSNLAPAAKKANFSQMIAKGSLKLRLMAERTRDNGQWKREYKRLGAEMLEKLKAACE